ncbi:uncharacterized protein V6R79_010692, partial [Siganus canaliculatus]
QVQSSRVEPLKLLVWCFNSSQPSRKLFRHKRNFSTKTGGVPSTVATPLGSKSHGGQE